MFDLGDGTVLKIPYNNVGIRSNELEYEYFKKKPNVVAKIYRYENNLIIQEKLDNIVNVPYEHTLKGTVHEYLKEKGIEVDEKLLKEMLNTKAQLGTDVNGDFKFFDYEDAKLNNDYVLESFRMSDKWIEPFWDYVRNYDICNIREWETFEEHRVFLVDYDE